jgi:VWFA-related protein
VVGTRRSFRYFLPAAFVAASSVLIGLGLGQEPRVSIEPRPLPKSSSTGTADRQLPRLQVNVDLVLIPVLVTDPQDRLITGLGKEHFKIYDNKVEKQITHFAREDAPVSIGLVFDCSGSMGPKLRQSRAAVAEFIRSANPEDEFSLVTFSDHARMVAGFDAGNTEIQNQLLFLQPKGDTALLDAIYLSMSGMRHAKHKRKAILIISDGGDNASRYTVREVKNWIREADVQIYSIGIFESPAVRTRTVEETLGPVLLQEIAESTGGRLFEVFDLNDLRDIATKIGNALRNQYVIGFTAGAEHDGKYHHIQVKIPKIQGLPKLRASFRSGYYDR